MAAGLAAVFRNHWLGGRFGNGLPQRQPALAAGLATGALTSGLAAVFAAGLAAAVFAAGLAAGWLPLPLAQIEFSGQGIDLAVQRLQFRFAGRAQSRNSTVRQRESLFQLAPGIHARFGRAGARFAASALPTVLLVLLGLLPSPAQRLEVFAAVTANLRVHA